ncbi:hypothetical protein ACI1UM_10665 [Lactococcus petauri]|uniref:hypothetical protein n=1 Tax=Lactococcus petauri TaxID=1940789 RepID=UPI003852B529
MSIKNAEQFKAAQYRKKYGFNRISIEGRRQRIKDNEEKLKRGTVYYTDVENIKAQNDRDRKECEREAAELKAWERQYKGLTATQKAALTTGAVDIEDIEAATAATKFDEFKAGLSAADRALIEGGKIDAATLYEAAKDEQAITAGGLTQAEKEALSAAMGVK